MIDKDAALMQLMRDYDAVCQELAAIQASLHAFGERLSDLGQSLKEEAHHVHAIQGGFQVPSRITTDLRDIPESQVSLAELRSLLTQRAEVVQRKERMEGCLRTANLDRFIRE